MGCCQSTPRANDGNSAPNDGQAPSHSRLSQVDSSRTSISGGPRHSSNHDRTASSPTRTAIQVSNEARASRRNRRRNRNNEQASSSHQNLAQKNRPNAPLQPPKSWRSTSRTWTPSQLQREREIFWDTRVTGRDEVWAALKMSVEMIGLRAGNRRSGIVSGGVDGTLDDIGTERDVDGAQAVLDAAGVTCPTGRMGEGVWDERGVLYKLPRWAISDPVNVQPDTAETAADVADDDEIVAEENDEDDEGKEGLSDGEIDAAMSPSPADLSAEKENGGKKIRVRARRSDGGKDVVVELDKSATVKTLLKKIAEEANVSARNDPMLQQSRLCKRNEQANNAKQIQPPPKKLKLAYLGKILRDSQSFTDQGYQSGHVLNILIFP
ncbi:MAG: hypothetical protein M1831_003036 [Alyxoria varia]|nr:MAG: hypothetical protein M1831_003036 [Alyxoria varia]